MVFEMGRKFKCLNYGIGSTAFTFGTSENACAGNGKEGVGTYIQQSGNNKILDIMKTVNDKMNKCVIAAGTNDFGESKSIDEFRTAVRETLDYALSKTPYILVLTPIKRKGVNNKNQQGKVLYDYSKVIIEECETRGIAYCDGFSVSLYPDNEINKSTFIPDGLHPNNKGQKRMARSYYNKFLEIMEN